jgi:hypothetical protein
MREQHANEILCKVMLTTQVSRQCEQLRFWLESDMIARKVDDISP